MRLCWFPKAMGTLYPSHQLSPQSYTSSKTDTKQGVLSLSSPEKLKPSHVITSWKHLLLCAPHFLCIILFHFLSDHVKQLH